MSLSEFLGEEEPTVEVKFKHIQGGNVPGGHNVIYRDNEANPFIPPTKECSSIPLLHTDVVVDIGAYVGTYAIRCARFPVKKVYAYEPTKQTFDILSLTKLHNLELLNAAVVGDDSKYVELNISKGIGVTNSIVLGSKTKFTTERVPAVNYSTAVQEATIVKIDVEGAEFGYIGQLIHPRMRGIIVDFHKAGKDWKEKSRAIVNEILSHGFSTVIEPNFDGSGWEQAGSWIRTPPVESTEVDDDLMNGRVCCGCGTHFDVPTGSKTLCETCWPTWSKKHRDGYKKYGD